MSNPNKKPRGIRPVTRIELSESNVKLRFILIVVFLAIASVALVVGLTSLLNMDPGWQEVEVSSSVTNCSADFTLNYYFGDAGVSATVESKQLSQLYTGITEDAYRIFSPDYAGEDVRNVCYINQHPNEEIVVDEALYQALELIDRYDNRCIYLAPVYVEYNRVFSAESDAHAMLYDPTRNQEAADYISQVMNFVSDPAMIGLELLGNNTLRLNVAQAYLSFAAEYGIEDFLDFGWMTNAFIADYIADVLTQNGFTSGYLASYDGFTRNLDDRSEVFGFNIFDRIGNDFYRPGAMYYTGPISIVFLRNYPMSDKDRWNYYGYEDGIITSALIDAADGISKSSVNNLVSYSETDSCAEILMRMIPVFIADDFSQERVNGWTSDGIYSVWCEDGVVRYNEADLELELAEASDGKLYSKAYAGQ